MDKLTTTLKNTGKNLLGPMDALAGALFVVLEVPSIQAKLVEEVGCGRKTHLNQKIFQSWPCWRVLKLPKGCVWPGRP